MRKYMAICVALMFALFMVAALAQNPSSGQASPGYGTPSGQQTPDQSQAGSMSGQTGQSSSSASQSNTGKERTVEGCIVREESDFFLLPKHGNPIRLSASGSENPGAHEGHRVKVHGNESALGAGGASAGASGGVAGATTETPPSASGQAGQAGAVGQPSAPSAGAGASAGGNDLHKLADKELTVDKIDMVSDTCPADWNPHMKSPGGSSDTTKPPQ